METEKKSNEALVGLIIIILILIIGGIYIFISNKNAAEKMKNLQTQLQTATNQDSVALDTLEQDIIKTDTETGVDVNTID